MGEVLKKFGRYFLLDQVAQGGMAEIYRARLAAADGAGRLLVIKRVMASYGSNNEFIQMFKSEIKVMMGFNHPNIVQLYDYGEEHNQPYIAMEFVDGRSLRQFSLRFVELKKTVPIELCTYVIEQSAAGLHYAHTFKDKISGQPLNIVHRDISPQNILISWDGNVKVIDFGIAKANTNSENTRAGIIKGKPSYLSPEQITGETLDGRCDIFALGIVLWEILTGKKLFAGENDLAVLKLIESSQTSVKPPSTVNALVPKELDAIVMRALTKQRERRYQTAEEFQRALHKFTVSFNPEFDPSDLSYVIKDLFKNEIVDDRKNIQKLNDKVEKLLALDIAKSAQKRASSEKKEDDDTDVDVLRIRATGSRQVFDVNTIKDSHVEIEAAPAVKKATSGPSRGTGGPTPSGGGGSQSRVPQQRPFKSKPALSADSIRKALIPIAAAGLGLYLYGPDLGLFGTAKQNSGQKTVAGTPAQNQQASNPGENVAIPTTDSGVPAAGNSKTVSLRLIIEPSTVPMNVSVNGKKLDAMNLVTEVPLDTQIEISVEKTGYRPFKKVAAYESARMPASREFTQSIALTPTRYGFLTVDSTPRADASIDIDGHRWIYRAPIKDVELPVGTYNVELENTALGVRKTISVTIEDGKMAIMKDISLY